MAMFIIRVLLTNALFIVYISFLIVPLWTKASEPQINTNIKPDYLQDLLIGLRKTIPHTKFIPSKWHYDQRGSEIYEKILELPNYYICRIEKELLSEISDEIANFIEDNSALIEFGSGSSEKTLILISSTKRITSYFPIDISESALLQASKLISNHFPDRYIHPIYADFSKQIKLPNITENYSKVGFFPGSTLGNFNNYEMQHFFQSARDLLGPNAIFITGFDMIKDKNILMNAYTDDVNISSTFNKNVLYRANIELGSNFNLDQFSHRVTWNNEMSRIDLYLVSNTDQWIKLSPHEIDTDIHFLEDDTIHTFYSKKFSLQDIYNIGLETSNGWTVEKIWQSKRIDFAIALFRAT